VETIERALAEEGPLNRLQLRERIDAAGVRTEGRRWCICCCSRRCAA